MRAGVKTEVRMQRTISRLQKQIADLKGSRNFWQGQRNDAVKALVRIADGQVMRGNFSHLDTVMAYRKIATEAVARAREGAV